MQVSRIYIYISRTYGWINIIATERGHVDLEVAHRVLRQSDLV